MKEYKRVPVWDTKFDAVINDHAKKGWEVLSIFQAEDVLESPGGGRRHIKHNTYVCFLVRDVPEEK